MYTVSTKLLDFLNLKFSKYRFFLTQKIKCMQSVRCCGAQIQFKLMLFITNLPEEIIRLLQSFLSHEDYRYFINISKEYFAEIRKKTIYFELAYSYSYVNNLQYRKMILDEVENGWKQISLHFIHNYPSITSTIPIHKITINGIYTSRSIFEEISHIESIHITDSFRGTSIPPIPKVKELTLLVAQEIKDLRHLSHLHHLRFSSRDVVDISPLSEISDLTLENCSKVKDFSMLNSSKQKHLSLTSCPFLCNVNNFQGIHKLRLKACKSNRCITIIWDI